MHDVLWRPLYKFPTSAPQKVHHYVRLEPLPSLARAPAPAAAAAAAAVVVGCELAFEQPVCLDQRLREARRAAGADTG